MKRYLASVILLVAFSVYFTGVFTEKGSTDLSSLSEAPSASRSFASFKLQPLPLKAQDFPKLTSTEEAHSYLATVHERVTQNWKPSYSVFIPYFDSLNRPYFREHDRAQTVPITNGFQTFQAGKLVTNSISLSTFNDIYSAELTQKVSGSSQDILWDPKMAVFDQNDQMYTVTRMNKNLADAPSYLMLQSKDYGVTWTATPIVGTPTTACVFKNIKTGACQTPELYDIERPYSKEALPTAPAFLHYVGSGKLPGYEKAPSWLGTYGRLYLQPVKDTPEGLKPEAPILISEMAQEIGYRSGGAPKIIHSGEKYFVVWLEATPSYVPKMDQNGQPIVLAPDSSENPFSAIWIAEYNTRTKILAKQELLKTWPVNDTHNQPGIVRASDGTLHVIGGGHGSHFTYTYSLKPDSIASWSQAVPMNTQDSGYKARYSSPNWTGGSQTYISMMIDSKDQIHTVYRQWAHDKSVFDFDYFGALVYQKGSYDKKTKKFVWDVARILVYPNASEYTHWYQLLNLDKQDHLYIEYSNSRPAVPYFFKTADGKAINVSPMLNNALLRSDDEGFTWYFPSDQDFIQSAQDKPIRVPKTRAE
ncbi:BNR-4 repeat-containing protein [Bdellovibrio sp. NC01]|uniref:BNR-4 repeat-containing protein n=1 Tax=Bdellovibrio sp. NC01 TaxID=2220073 RepID=UPI00115A925D|nr:BNR-4 repeat-containing protein [Bdellovibrio sp. NC01]QDK37852.1 hypothetical protein DOE51_09780 [Bdellovibrio sp. NC01]